MKKINLALVAVGLAVASMSASATDDTCGGVTFKKLQDAVNNVARNTGTLDAPNGTGGFGLNMWASVVDNTGKVCFVANTGTKGADAGNSQWLGSRVISAQKANTANAFSLDAVSISTGALMAAVQPGGSLYGLQHSNPVDAEAAYEGNPKQYGKANDPLVGKRIGGVNIFGGGIALYNSKGVKVGAVGVSGDTSCTDHAFAWKVREALGLATSPGGFELLNISPTFAALGDHADCAGSASIVNNGAFGFK